MGNCSCASCPAAGATVLQVVAQGAVHPTPVNNQPAIYIDGQWVHQRQAIVWKYGTQAELLYQADGLIFGLRGPARWCGRGDAGRIGPGVGAVVSV